MTLLQFKKKTELDWKPVEWFSIWFGFTTEFDWKIGLVLKKKQMNWTISCQLIGLVGSFASYFSRSLLGKLPPLIHSSSFPLPAARSRIPKDCGALPSLVRDESFPDSLLAFRRSRYVMFSALFFHRITSVIRFRSNRRCLVSEGLSV